MARQPQSILSLLCSEVGLKLIEPLRFVWNATRGHRLTPWRSPFLRWRVETYSGQKAETLTAKSMFGFLWTERWELLRFLRWTGQMEREARKKDRGARVAIEPTNE